MTEFKTIHPERKYTIRQTAKLLGIHRCTVYTYIKRVAGVINPGKSENGHHVVLKGKDLLTLKKAQRKKGRKRLQ